MKSRLRGKIIGIVSIALFLYFLLYVFPDQEWFNVNSFLNWDALNNWE